jgi:hypothetical protein
MTLSKAQTLAELEHSETNKQKLILNIFFLILVPFPALFLFIFKFAVYSVDTIFFLGDGLTRLLLHS